MDGQDAEKLSFDCVARVVAGATRDQTQEMLETLSPKSAKAVRDRARKKAASPRSQGPSGSPSEVIGASDTLQGQRKEHRDVGSRDLSDGMFPRCQLIRGGYLLPHPVIIGHE